MWVQKDQSIIYKSFIHNVLGLKINS